MIPAVWWNVAHEADSAASYVVFETKKCAAVLTAVDSDHLSALNSMRGYLGEANDILRRMVEHEQATIDPPGVAEFLLTLFAASSRAEAVIGDLNEHFTRECKEFGRHRAVRLYWARTLRSLWPLMTRAIGKLLRWGAVIAAVRQLF